MPKILRNEYDKKLTYENLLIAHYKSRKGKGYRDEILSFLILPLSFLPPLSDIIFYF